MFFLFQSGIGDLATTQTGKALIAKIFSGVVEDIDNTTS